MGAIIQIKQLVLPDILCNLGFLELPSQILHYLENACPHTFLPAVESQGSPARFCKASLVFSFLQPEACSAGKDMVP